MTDGIREPSEPVSQAEMAEALAIQSQCNKIVEGFRASKISKANAIAGIKRHIPAPLGALGIEDPKYKLAVEAYTRKLDAHERELADAAAAGGGRSKSNTPKGRGSVESERADKSHDGGSRAASEHSHGHRSHSRRTRSPSISRSGSSGPATKRAKFDEASLPWTVENIVETATLHPELQETIRLIKLYAVDPKRTKQSITTSASCPELPDSEWGSILAGRAVDLDIVFSGFHSSDFDQQRESDLGGGARLIMGAADASKKVTTHHQWFIAWTKASTGIEIAFPHRKRELAQYLSHISGLFASVSPAVHHRIISYDKAVRRLVGLVRNVRLTDYSQFEDIRTSWLTSYGANVVAEASSSRVSQGGPAKRAKSKEACRNWNANKCKVPKCNYAHVCSECGGKHVQADCTVKK
jgi:hypothetical protein